MMYRYRYWLLFLLVFVVGRLLLSTLLPLTDFSEARYAEIARKILLYDDWTTLWFFPDLPFWGKPPLAFWSVAVSFMTFGVNELAARLPSLIYTLLTAGIIGVWTSRYYPRGTAIGAAAIYLSTFITLQTAGAVIMDPLLVLSTTLVMASFYEAVTRRDVLAAYLMWIALGIGLLAKGPLALALCGLAAGTWVLVYGEWRRFFTGVRLFSGLVVMLAVAAPWYFAAEQKTPGFIDYFLIGEHIKRYLEPEWSGDLYGGVKDQPLGTIWIYFLAASLPWSLFAIVRACRRRTREGLMASYRAAPLFTGYLLCWLLLPPLFFTPAQNILITYVMPAMPALAILIAGRFELLVLPQRFWPASVIATSLVFFAGFWAIWQLEFEDHHYNQLPLIRAYQALAKTDPGPLIYTGAHRFSAEFYTRSQVVFTARPDAYVTSSTFYVAVRDMWAGSPVPGRCKDTLHHSEFTLWYCPATPAEQ